MQTANLKTLPFLQIGGHYYRVELINAYSTDGGCSAGEAEHNDQVIKVALQGTGGQLRTLSKLEETLLHEITHSVAVIWNVNLNEEQIAQISEGLYQVLKQFGVKLLWE